MKNHILICLLFGLLCRCAWSQTADDYVNQGLSDLAAHDLVDANASFSQALSLNPAHENANALYAITRLLILPAQPAGSNFLTHIGLPICGRNIYGWSALPPVDANGLLLAPDGVNADEFATQLRTNVLLSVAGAIGNLSSVTDTSFLLNLTSDQTALADVTLDFGDLKMIQAGLYASEYFIYTLNAQNLDAQLTAVRALYTNGVLSAGQLLADYPQLFTFSTTNDLSAARGALTNAINDYMIASAFIRARPANEVRLFNFDQGSLTTECKFRCTLADLENSLTAPQVLSLRTNVTVNLADSFNGKNSLRSWFPHFQGNGIVLGTFPDPTFGGIVEGLIAVDVESYLSTYLAMLPFGHAPAMLENGVQLSFETLPNHSYDLEVSTNLTDWEVIATFTATNCVSTLVDSQNQGGLQGFYRLRDNTGWLVLAGTVLDYDTGLPFAGAEVYSLWDGTTTYSDANGQFYLFTTLRSWGADFLQVSAAGYFTTDNFYFDSIGNGLISGLQIEMYLPGEFLPGGYWPPGEPPPGGFTLSTLPKP